MVIIPILIALISFLGAYVLIRKIQQKETAGGFVVSPLTIPFKLFSCTVFLLAIGITAALYGIAEFLNR